MATLAYALYRRLGITGMLVFDVQRLLARYEERLDATAGSPVLFDLVSNEPVVLPRHFASLIERMPDAAADEGWEADTVAYLRGKGPDVRPPE